MLEGARAERWQRKRTGLPFPNVVFGSSVTTRLEQLVVVRFFISSVPGSDRAEGGGRGDLPTLSASRTRRHIASLRSWVCSTGAGVWCRQGSLEFKTARDHYAHNTVSHQRLPPCPSESRTHLFTPRLLEGVENAAIKPARA